ncbi:MAG TPA: hypothetical protein VIU85_09025 [Chthoniobacterales bacterium]
MKQPAALMVAAAIWLSAIALAFGQTVANNSFELPPLTPNSFLYDPSDPGWIFTGNAGIINAPGAGFFGPAAPDGGQYAFLQSGGKSGAFSQSINFSLSGTFLLSYLVAGRSDNGQGAAGDLNYQVLLDSTIIAIDATTTSQPFTTRVIQFNAGAGSHILTFAVSPGATGDNAAFFDSIAITVPEPTSSLLVLTFAPLLSIARRIRRRN